MNLTAPRSVSQARLTPPSIIHGWRKPLLAAGAAASALWVATDIVASLLHDGYSYKDQTISELSAIGAPTRTAMLASVSVYSALVIAFGVGVWTSARSRRALRAVAALLIANGTVNLLLTPFSSMHQRDVLAAGGGTLTDTLHLAVALSNVLTFFVVIALGAATFHGRMRLYSLLTMAALLVFGSITGMSAPRVASNDPTPWLGITERASAYGWMLWVAVLAIVLMRAEQPRSQDEA